MLQEGVTDVPVGVLTHGKRVVRGVLEPAQRVPVMELACLVTSDVQPYPVQSVPLFGWLTTVKTYLLVAIGLTRWKLGAESPIVQMWSLGSHVTVGVMVYPRHWSLRW